VIFATTRPTLNRMAIIPSEYNKNICSTGFTVLRAKSEIIDAKYIFYSLQIPDFMQRMEKMQRGASYPAVSDKDVKDFKIPVPPLPEQKQIVTTLDKTFKQIDQAKANLEKNLNNAKELFQSKLNEVFSQRGEGWVEKKLNDTCIVERGSSPRPIKSFITDEEDGVNWVKIGDTKNVEKYIYKTNQKITKEGAKKSRFVDVGDFILSNSMSFGRPYIMKTQGYIHDGWFVFRLPENIDAEFFWYLLVSPNVKEQFQGLASGAIVKNISGDLVKKQFYQYL
jgi:type I restriction enzyme S subunit